MSEFKNECTPEDIALKSFFLGPMAENEIWLGETFVKIISEWCGWRRAQYPDDGSAISKGDQLNPTFIEKQLQFQNSVHELVHRFQSEIPKFSPRYMGHMFSEVSLPALLGHFVALLQNPNNISTESSRVGISIEHEAISALSEMVGYSPSRARGHFTSGGSVANFEAVLRAIERSRKKGISREDGVFLFPLHAHYSWKKSLSIFGIPERSVRWIELDSKGRVDLSQFELHLREIDKAGKRITLCVAVVGTTELGVMDPISKMRMTLEEVFPDENPWFHIDAAYGGFYASMNSPPLAVQEMNIADSITLDPHKLAYVPYSAGAFLCKEKDDYLSVSVDSPYIQYEESLDPGPFTIEGSRSATGASAVWMIQQTLGLNPEGLGRIIERTMQAKDAMLSEISMGSEGITPLDAGDSNIICLTCPRTGESVLQTNQRTQAVFDAMNSLKPDGFTVSKTFIDRARYQALVDRTLQIWNGHWAGDGHSEGLVVLRLCLMNPFTLSKELRVNYVQEIIRFIRETAQNK